MGGGISIDGVSVSVGSDARNISRSGGMGGKADQVESGQELLNQVNADLNANKNHDVNFSKAMQSFNEFPQGSLTDAASVTGAGFRDQNKIDKDKKDFYKMFDMNVPPSQLQDGNPARKATQLESQAQSMLMEWKCFNRSGNDYGKFFIETEEEQ